MLQDKAPLPTDKAEAAFDTKGTNSRFTRDMVASYERRLNFPSKKKSEYPNKRHLYVMWFLAVSPVALKFFRRPSHDKSFPPWLSWMKNVPSGHHRDARTTSPLHFSNASSAHTPGLLSVAVVWGPSLFFLPGLTSLSLGFCVGIK